MKIGIIGINIYPKYLNFACVLHTYAFQQFLLQHGIESTVIDYKPVYFENFDMRHPADYYRKLYEQKTYASATTPEDRKKKKAALSDLHEKVTAWTALYKEREVRFEKFQAFIKQHYVKTQEIYDSDLLETKDPGFDCYICVTDVIWGLVPGYIYDRGFFLASRCMDGKEKISYAASRGVPSPLTEEQERLFFRYLEDIDSISVREKSLQQFIEGRSDKKAALVLDPVMLHSKGFWQKLSIKPDEERYIVLYYVMERATDTIRAAVEYARLHNLLIIELSDRPSKKGRVIDPRVKHITKYDIGPEEWLGYLEYAECIFTNSFHGCCFAALFEKELYAGKRDGDKVTNILEILGLEDRRLPEAPPTRLKRLLHILGRPGYTFKNFPASINYAPVSARLEQKRQESEDFLLQAINQSNYRINNEKTKNKTNYDAHRRNLRFPIHYHSGLPGTTNTYDTHTEGAHLQQFDSGNCEYAQKGKLYQNNGTSVFEKNQYSLQGYRFMGWKLRIKIDTKWFWYMEDGTLGRKEDYGESFSEKKKRFPDKGQIPYLPVNHISLIVAEAAWEAEIQNNVKI